MPKTIVILSAMLLGAALSPAAAQDYPTKQPVKIVVSYNAGGLTDVLARITADALSKRIGQSVVVENRPGAAGAVGAEFVAKSAPDGYTLLMSPPEIAVLPAVRTNLPFTPDSFTYLVRGFTTQPVVGVGPHVAANTFEELIKYAKDNPGKLRYGTPGVGHWVHLQSATMENALGFKGRHVPYPGSAPIYTDMIAGNVDMTFGNPPFPQGLKVIASLADERHPGYPDAPTMAELGHKDLSYTIWFGLSAPKGLPKGISDKLISEVTAVYKDPAVIEQIKTSAKIVPDAEPLTGDAFRNAVLEEAKRWKATAEREKITVEQ